MPRLWWNLAGVPSKAAKVWCLVPIHLVAASNVVVRCWVALRRCYHQEREHCTHCFAHDVDELLVSSPLHMRAYTSRTWVYCSIVGRCCLTWSRCSQEQRIWSAEWPWDAYLGQLDSWQAITYVIAVLSRCDYCTLQRLCRLNSCLTEHDISQYAPLPSGTLSSTNLAHLLIYNWIDGQCFYKWSTSSGFMRPKWLPFRVWKLPSNQKRLPQQHPQDRRC
jgi:hypothetical protein